MYQHEFLVFQVPQVLQNDQAFWGNCEHSSAALKEFYTVNREHELGDELNGRVDFREIGEEFSENCFWAADVSVLHPGIFQDDFYGCGGFPRVRLALEVFES